LRTIRLRFFYFCVFCFYLASIFVAFTETERYLEQNRALVAENRDLTFKVSTLNRLIYKYREKEKGNFCYMNLQACERQLSASLAENRSLLINDALFEEGGSALLSLRMQVEQLEALCKN